LKCILSVAGGNILVSRLGAQATHLSGLGVEKILVVGGLSGGCCGLGPRDGLLDQGGRQRGGRGRRRGPEEEEAAAAESPEVVPWALVSGMRPRSWRAAFWVGEGAGEEAG